MNIYTPKQHLTTFLILMNRILTRQNNSKVILRSSEQPGHKWPIQSESSYPFLKDFLKEFLNMSFNVGT